MRYYVFFCTFALVKCLIMSESKYVSQVKTIPARVEDVYRVLGNLQNLERVKDLIPQDKIQELRFPVMPLP